MVLELFPLGTISKVSRRETQLGLRTYANQHTPQLISLSESIVEISCGIRHTVVLTKCGELYTWGHNKYGQLGLSDIINKNIPQKLILNESIISIQCGNDITLAITNLNKIYVWGYNDGRLGSGDDAHQFSPRELILS